MLENNIRFSTNTGFFSSPHCTASAKSSNYNVCIYDHRIDHIISSASQSSSSFIQWFLFRNKSILTGAFRMNVRSYTPAILEMMWYSLDIDLRLTMCSLGFKQLINNKRIQVFAVFIEMPYSEILRLQLIRSSCILDLTHLLLTFTPTAVYLERYNFWKKAWISRKS